MLGAWAELAAVLAHGTAPGEGAAPSTDAKLREHAGAAWWARDEDTSPEPPHPAPAPPAQADPGVGVVIATSGSTGAPRFAQFTAAAVLASARAALQVLGGPGHWLLALPTSHAAGVQVLARSWIAGLPPVRLASAGHAALDRTTAPHEQWCRDFARAAAQLDRHHRHYTSLVPTQVVRLLDGPAEGLRALASFDAVLVGGAGFAPDAAARARTAGVRVVTTYGATETCGGCVYDGVPLPGYGVAVDGATGAIRLRGPSLMTGYAGDLAATQDVLRDGWFHTPDVGTLTQGRLTVLGRQDDVINTGGVKVAPAPVADAVAAVPPVREAAVVPTSDPHWGQAVVAVVELRAPGNRPGGASALDAAWFAQVRNAVGNRLGRSHAPQAVVILPHLPRLGLGKVDRRALLAVVDGLPRPVRGPIDLRPQAGDAPGGR